MNLTYQKLRNFKDKNLQKTKNQESFCTFFFNIA